MKHDSLAQYFNRHMHTHIVRQTRRLGIDSARLRYTFDKRHAFKTCSNQFFNSFNCNVQHTRVMMNAHIHKQQLNFQTCDCVFYSIHRLVSVCLIPFLWLIQSLLFPCSHCISIHFINVFFHRLRLLLLLLITLIQRMRLQSIHSHSQNNRMEFHSTRYIYRHFMFLNNFEVLQYENHILNRTLIKTNYDWKGRENETLHIHSGSHFHSIPFKCKIDFVLKIPCDRFSFFRNFIELSPLFTQPLFSLRSSNSKQLLFENGFVFSNKYAPFIYLTFFFRLSFAFLKKTTPTFNSTR